MVVFYFFQNIRDCRQAGYEPTKRPTRHTGDVPCVCSNHDELDVLVEAAGVRHLGMLSDANDYDDHVQQTTNSSITRLRATHVSDAVTIKIATHSSRVQYRYPALYIFESMCTLHTVNPREPKICGSPVLKCEGREGPIPPFYNTFHKSFLSEEKTD
jgi:hypothetical protein